MWNKVPKGLAHTRQLTIILQGESRSVSEHCTAQKSVEGISADTPTNLLPNRFYLGGYEILFTD